MNELLPDYQKFLLDHKLAQEKNVPYYLKWVSYCYLFPEQPDSCLLSSERIESYLHHISKTREDWQMKQITPSDTASPPLSALRRIRRGEKIRGEKGEL